MPSIGERSTHDCPDCGQPMYWSDAAIRGRHLPTKAAREAVPTIEYIDAYQCANGHTSQECPLCGGYDTAAWRDRENLHYHVICGNCGNDSIVNK